MTIYDMAAAARRAIANNRCEGKAVMVLVVPGRWPTVGDSKRLAGRRGGPLGRCISEKKAAVICAFKAAEVLAWCEKQPHVTPLEEVR